MDQNSFLNVTKRVQRKTSVVQRWQEASEIYLDTEGRGRAMDLLAALSQRVVEDFSPYKLNDLLKDKGAKAQFFIMECVNVCVEKHENFWPFIEHIRPLILANRDVDDVLSFLSSVVNVLWEKEMPELLTEFLTRKEFEMLVKHANVRSKLKSLLMRSCRKEKDFKSPMVRVLIEHDCRLNLSTNDNIIQSENLSAKCWSLLPTLILFKEIQIDDKRDDEINNLTILKMMARKNYILSCYEVMVGSKIPVGQRHMKKLGVDIDDCTCAVKNGYTSIPGAQMSIKGSNVPFHYCPANDYFVPNLFCKEHVECNDPIYRCFAVAKMAKGLANNNPEFRQEYEEIAEHCSELPVQLLTQCQSTDEVKTILAESACSSKLFRYAGRMKYPRLQLAIEDHHVDFVGHMYCQQTLRRSWYEKLPWKQASTLSKFIHFCIQMVMAPFLAIIIGLKSSIKSAGIRPGSLYCNAKHLDTIFDWMNKQWDTALNRFLIYTGYYFIFVICLFATFIKEKDSNQFYWAHYLLCLFAASMLGNAVNKFIATNSMGLTFWNFFDLLQYSILLSGLAIRFFRTTFEKKGNFDPDQTDPVREAEAFLISVSATVAIFRGFYWFVMSEVIGPIAINIVRVFKDVATTLITYGLFLLGFTLGFFMLLYYYIQSKHDLSHDVVDDAAKRAEALQVIAPKVIVQLMFATFNPEEIDWEAINVINNTKAYPNQETDPKKPYKPGSIFGNGHYADFARTFLIAFLLVSVIVLLNVLIAAMNNTVQMFEGRRTLNWKYYQAVIMIEYFQDDLPSPFEILSILPWTICGIRKLLKKICSCNCNIFGKDAERGNSRIVQRCEGNKNAERIKHAKLMQKLIDRLRESNEKGMVEKHTIDVWNQSDESVKRPKNGNKRPRPQKTNSKDEGTPMNTLKRTQKTTLNEEYINVPLKTPLLNKKTVPQIPT